jgi:hypothetical protein
VRRGEKGHAVSGGHHVSFVPCVMVSFVADECGNHFRIIPAGYIHAVVGGLVRRALHPSSKLSLNRSSTLPSIRSCSVGTFCTRKWSATHGKGNFPLTPCENLRYNIETGELAM